jgi:CrcB protein
MSAVATVFAGCLGALARYLIAGVVQRRSNSTFPVGTAAVNLVGSLLVGAVAGVASVDSYSSVAALGFLGGFTTFSTWAIETVWLGIVPRPRRRAIVNSTAVVVLCIALAGAGYSLTS